MEFKGEYHFLNTLSPCSISVQGLTFPTAEHAYRALSTDDDIVRGFLANPPAKLLHGLAASRHGRMDGFPLKRGWCEAMKIEAMEEVLLAKFTQHDDLGQLLCDTYPDDLVFDIDYRAPFWGKVFGVGQNNLGLILQRIRGKLLATQAAAAKVTKRRTKSTSATK